MNEDTAANLQAVCRTTSINKDSTGRSARTFGETIRFGLVGGLNTAVDFAMFLVLTHLCHWSVVAAQTVSYTLGLMNSYVWNRKVTFKGTGKPPSGELIRFVSLNLASYLASLLVLFGMQQFFFSNVASKLVATVVTFAINFSGSKWWVFKSRTNAELSQRADTANHPETSA